MLDLAGQIGPSLLFALLVGVAVGFLLTDRPE